MQAGTKILLFLTYSFSYTRKGTTQQESPGQFMCTKSSWSCWLRALGLKETPRRLPHHISNDSTELVPWKCFCRTHQKSTSWEIWIQASFITRTFCVQGWVKINDYVRETESYHWIVFFFLKWYCWHEITGKRTTSLGFWRYVAPDWHCKDRHPSELGVTNGPLSRPSRLKRVVYLMEKSAS